jgi:Cdc6-like AAA superfamily ATPase
MELDTCNLVNAKTLEEMLNFMLNERWNAPDDRLPAVMIWGPPGVGKSAIVRSVAEKNNCPLQPVTAEVKKETFHLNCTLINTNPVNIFLWKKQII